MSLCVIENRICKENGHFVIYFVLMFLLVINRSTSMRTMASTRSHGATPNTGTLNSRDIHFHNTSASSGSHTLDMNMTRETLDAMGHRIETAEVHDDSSQSGSRSINSPKKDRDRDFSAPSGSDDQLDEDDEHYSHQKGAPQVPQGAHDEFNYSYYKLSYDGSHQYQSVNQNANDNDDNVSQDSYHLRNEEPGTPESLDHVLQSDDDGLDESGEGHSEGNDKAKLIDRQRREGGEGEKQKEKGEIEGEQLKENGDRQQGERKVEIEIVEKVETISSFQKSPSMEKHDMDEIHHKNAQNGQSLLNGKSPTPVRRDSTEISYVLHRRMMPPSTDAAGAKMTQSKSAPQHLASFKQTSPTKAIGSPKLPLTSEQRKAELDRIKSSLSTPIVTGKQPLSKSPGTKRAYDLVKYNRLPPRDSYSYIDDSISPSNEKDIISHLRASKPAVPQKPPRDLDKKGMVLPGLVPSQDKAHLVPPRATMEDLTPTTETDSDSESPLPKDSPLEEERGQGHSDCAGDKSSTSGSEAEHARAKRRAYRLNSKSSNKDIPFADEERVSSDDDGQKEKKRLSSSVSSEPLPTPPTPMDESPSDDFEHAIAPVESPSEVFEKSLEDAGAGSPVKLSTETKPQETATTIDQLESPTEDFEKRIEEELQEARAVQEDDYLDNMRLNDDLPSAPPPPLVGDISSEDDVEHPDADDFTDSAAILEAQRRPTLEAIASGFPCAIPQADDHGSVSPSDEFEKSLEYDLNLATQHIQDGQFSGEESSDSEGSLPPPPPPPPVTHQGSISSEGEVEGPDADDFDITTTTAILQAQRAPTIEADYPLSDHRQIELPPDIGAGPVPADMSSESDEDNGIDTLPEMDKFEQKFEMEMNIDEEEDIQLLNEDGEVPGAEEEKTPLPGKGLKKARGVDSSDSCSSDSDVEPGATGGLPAPPPVVDISSESDVERPTAEDLPDPVAYLASGSVFANPYMLHQLPEEDSSDSDPPPPPPPPTTYDTSLYANLPEPPSGQTLGSPGFTAVEREGYGTIPGQLGDDMEDPLESLEHLERLSETDSDKRKESESDSSSESDLEDVGPLVAHRQLHQRPQVAPKPRNVPPMSFAGQGEVIGNPSAAMTTPEGEKAPRDGVFSNPYAEPFGGQGPPRAPPRTSSVQPPLPPKDSSPRH